MNPSVLLAGLLASAGGLASAPMDAPVAIARTLIETLHEGGSLGLPAGGAVAVRLMPGTGAEALVAAVLDALPAPLETLGARVLTGAPDIPEARAAGAEWLLSVGFRPIGEGTIVARLDEIDRGPFEPFLPRLVAQTEVRLTPALTALRPPVALGTSPRASPPARPLTLLRWPRPIWALIACPGRDGRDYLLIAEEKAVHLLALGARRSARALALDGELRAREPVRAPFAVLRCGPPGRAGLGHGQLQKGLILAFDEARLVIDARLQGWPVGYTAEGWWKARPDAGRRRFAPPLYRPDDAVLTLEAPLIELALSPEGRIYGVDESLTLRRLTATGALGFPLSPAGLGLSVRVIEDELVLAATGPDGAADRVMVFRENQKRELALPAPGTAAAVGRPLGRWVVLAAVADGARARVLAWPLEGEP